MKVLICGDRNWNDYITICNRIQKLPYGTIVIHGDCRGADKLAGKAAEVFGFKVQKFPANWETFGLAAGPIRNIEMLDEEPDRVIAFHEDIDKSKGTAHTVKEALNRRIPVEIISCEEDVR